MSRTCIECLSSALRGQAGTELDRTLRKMAASGLVNCLRSPHRATFYPLHSTCPRYSPASPEVIQARQAWAQRFAPGAATTEPRS